MSSDNLYLKDRYLTCCDCGERFIFEVGEQEYYIKRKLNIPRRCPKCRAIRKLDNSPSATKGGD